MVEYSTRGLPIAAEEAMRDKLPVKTYHALTDFKERHPVFAKAYMTWYGLSNPEEILSLDENNTKLLGLSKLLHTNNKD